MITCETNSGDNTEIPKELKTLNAYRNALANYTLLVERECFNRCFISAFVSLGHFSSNSAIAPATSGEL